MRLTMSWHRRQIGRRIVDLDCGAFGGPNILRLRLQAPWSKLRLDTSFLPRLFFGARGAGARRAVLPQFTQTALPACIEAMAWD